MTRARSLRGGLLALLVAAAPAGSDGDPRAYRLRVPVTSGSGSTVQRLALPAAALVAAQTRDLADLRIFDADGRAMPIARATPNRAALRRDTLKALPILGAADALSVRRSTLRIDPEGRARVAQVDGDVAPSVDRPVVLGALLDARTLRGAARDITLDVDVPEAQPVTFRVEASGDLSTWRPLGDTIVYRAPAANAGRTTAAVALGMAPIASDYFKVTWSTASRPLSRIVVRGATLVSRPSGAAALTYAVAKPPPPRDPHALVFLVPFATPITALRVMPQGDDLLVPIRIFGRDNAEQPWALLAEGTAAREATADMALPGRSYKTLKIEADARTPGFTSPPALRLGFTARDVLFLAAGSRPYVLAVGKPDVGDMYLAAPSLAAQGGGKPAAIATAGASDQRMTLPAIDDAALDRRKALLWAVLVLAAVILSLFAFILWRKNTIAPTSEIR